MILTLGVIGMAAQLTRTHSLRLIPVAIKEIIGYSFFIWSLLLGFLIWRDVPALPVILGSAVVITCNIYIVKREKNSNK